MTIDDTDRSLPFLRMNERPPRPRSVGITEARGPYYTVLGPVALTDLLDVAGPYVDWLKIPAPALALLPLSVLRRMIGTCHERGVKVSAGGLVELVLTRGPEAVDQYFEALQEYGFDVVEISAGFLALSTPDYLRLVERAKRTGMTVKAEVGVQFGAGGTSSADALESEGSLATSWAISRARGALDAGADMIILESEGVTESVRTWRTDVPAALVAELGLERVMFEAAEPAVFEWYVKNYGPDVNLFVDHSQVLQLEGLRSGIWGPSSLWGRVVTFRG